MNMFSFVDELVKLGAARELMKRAATIGSEPPTAMVGVDSVPESDDAWPDDVRTRLPLTASRTSLLSTGSLGGITQAKDPIDQYRFNRAYEGNQ